MKLNWKQIIALMSAVLLLVGCCLPVAASEPPWNDKELDWGDEPPVIVTQPADVAVYNGEEAVVSLVAEGDGLTYEWFYKNANASKFIAAIKFTGNTYSAEMSDSVNGRQVYCIITNEAGLSTQSDTATLTMLPDPVEPAKITKQPANATYGKEGETVKVSVEATGDDLTYQWYIKNDGKTSYSKSSVTTATYSAKMNATSHNRRLYVVVTDKHGNSVKSNVVLIRRAASIVTEPASATYAKEGATAKVTVKAVGDDLKYTWYIKNAGATKYSKSSVTSATYSVKMSAASNDRRLYCVVKDAYGKTVQSKTVLVRRQATITKEPATVAYAQNGKKASVKITAAGEGLTYTWYIKNATASKYSKSSVTSATYSATMSDSVKGRKVYCVVKDKYGKTVQSKTVVLRMSATITTQPKTVTVANKKTAKLTVKAKGDGLTYTWYIKNEGASKYSKSSVTKSTYSVTMSSKVKNRLVYVVVKDKYGNTVKSSTVRLKMK